MPLIKVNHDEESIEGCYGVVESEMQTIGNQFMRHLSDNTDMPQDQYSKELLCICIVHAVPATSALYYNTHNKDSNPHKITSAMAVEFMLTDPEKHIEALKYAFFTKVYYDNASPLMKILRTLEHEMKEN